MKIRQGFVSNSSSSSFVIMAPDATELRECIHCGRSDPDLFAVIKAMSSRSYMNDETQIWDEKDSLDLLADWAGYEEPEEVKLIGRIEQLVKDPPKGWKIRVVDIGHHDNGSGYMLENSKQSIVLMNDGSYDVTAIEKAEKMRRGES